MALMIGTSYFPSVAYAEKYYAPYGGGVEEKIKEGAIRIGQPPPRFGWQSYLDKEEGRWFRRQITPTKERDESTKRTVKRAES